MHGSVDRIRLLRLGGRNEVDAPHIGLVHPALFKDRAVILLQIILQLLIISDRKSSKAESYIFKVQNFGKLKVQVQIGADGFQQSALLFQLRLQLCFLPVAFLHEAVRRLHDLHCLFRRQCGSPGLLLSVLRLRSRPGVSIDDRRGLLGFSDPFTVGIAL